MNYSDLIELDDYTEDMQSINEPYFELDPFASWEVDLHYAQGE